MWKKFQDFFSNDVGIDLGTANTLVFMKGLGIVLREPSVVAKQKKNGRIIVGVEAKRMIGRTPGDIEAIRPMKSGVLADFATCEEMIRQFTTKAIKQAHRRSFRKPRVIVAVPSDITEVERMAVMDAAYKAGARYVRLVEEPMAAAIGVGLPVAEPAANMIVDIGGGTTEVALISLNGIVYAKSVRVGGDAMDDNIIQYMRRVYNLMIGERTAEEIKMKIGSACPLKKNGVDVEQEMEIKGRDNVTGLPKSLRITSPEIREALRESVSQIVDAVLNCLEKSPPELAADLVGRGMVLAGGGSLLQGLDKLLMERTSLPVLRAEDPLSAVAQGTGKILDDFDMLLRRYSLKDK